MIGKIGSQSLEIEEMTGRTPGKEVVLVEADLGKNPKAVVAIGGMRAAAGAVAAGGEAEVEEVAAETTEKGVAVGEGEAPAGGKVEVAGGVRAENERVPVESGAKVESAAKVESGVPADAGVPAKRIRKVSLVQHHSLWQLLMLRL